MELLQKKNWKTVVGVRGQHTLNRHCSFVVLFLKLFGGGILPGDKMQTIQPLLAFTEFAMKMLF